jgi:monoamine oxidase
MSSKISGVAVMLDVVIVGGGLCGLALANSLHEQGRGFALYEARGRLGGRILSVPCSIAAMTVDLGPTWYWPDTQPRISRLVSELGLVSFPQHDSGAVLRLNEADKKPETVAVDSVYGGAQRVEGGLGSLVDALAQRLPAECLHLGHELYSVRDRGDHVELHFRCGEVTVIVLARNVVLAVPPRLLEEHVRFDPPLEPSMREAMRSTHTWMADQAKVVVGYERPFWREAGQSGNAFVTHEQVVLGEIFDACDRAGEKAALGGFFALSPQFRASIHPAAMPMLISSQLVQVFDLPAENGEQHMQDWATERFTCSTLDLTPPDVHPEYGNPILRQRLWNSKVHFGASETAGYGGGYMEGALEAAARIHRSLAPERASTLQQVGVDGSHNAACLGRFSEWVAAQRSTLLDRYRQHLHQYLASQHREQLTQRALLGTVEQVYSEALDVLDGLPFDTSGVGIQSGRSDLTLDVLEPFDGFNMSLVEQAVQFNRGSCALSNFPGEHDPADDYMETISRDLVAAWREFAVSANGVLLAKGGAPAVHHSSC